MSLFGNTENHEISLPLDMNSSFSLVSSAAEIFGKVTDSNRTLGMIQFKKGMSLTRNPVVFNASLVSSGEQQTLIRISANSNDGIVGLNSVNRAYQEFLTTLSSLSK